MTPEEWERFQKRQVRKFERAKRKGSLKFFSGNLEKDPDCLLCEMIGNHNEVKRFIKSR